MRYIATCSTESDPGNSLEAKDETKGFVTDKKNSRRSHDTFEIRTSPHQRRNLAYLSPHSSFPACYSTRISPHKALIRFRLCLVSKWSAESKVRRRRLMWWPKASLLIIQINRFLQIPSTFRRSCRDRALQAMGLILLSYCPPKRGPG